MLPQTQARKKRNSSKVNLMISFIFHGLIIAVALYFAARQGFLGKQIQKISVEMVKEKAPEKPKPPEKPKEEPPKVEAARPEPPKVVEEARMAPPPSATAPPMVAPPAAELPSFDFEGGKQVESSSDPVHLYKGYMEFTLRSRWQRPDDVADDNYVADMAVTVDPQGNITDAVLEKGSGDKRWDETVKAVFREVTSLDRPPPKNFPSRVTVRFDVEQETELISQ